MVPAIRSGQKWELKMFGRTSGADVIPTYLEWQEAVDEVVHSQKELEWDPCRPRTTLGLSIFECVQSYLPKHLAFRLELYSAIGTSLDVHHGVDGFFMIDNFIVTIDLSTNQKEFFKSDVLMVRKDGVVHMWRTCLEIAHRLEKGLE